MEDHQETMICAGFAEYKKELPSKFLERAAANLAKKGYFVGFAGVFSAGKSTLINSLLREPGMLPSAIHSCTYSLTKVTSPGEGEEHIEVKYFTREDTLRYIIENPRYGPLLETRREEYLTNFSAEKALTIVKEVIESLREDPVPENQTKRRELLEYVDYLERFVDRLGGSHIDHDIKNAPEYLTTDENNKGHGHLLLIEEVNIFRRNPLFVEKGISICDLPGTGALNPRDTEIALTALRDSDLIIMVIPPQGFSDQNMILKRELEQHNNEIKNKIFFVVNRFDEILMDELTEEKLNKLMKEHIIAPIISMGLNPDRLYLTNAKMVELTLMGDRIDQAHKNALEDLKDDAQRKLKAIPEGLDKDLQDRMIRVFTDGGVDSLRADLVKYLERDIAIERLKEIYLDLRRVYTAVRHLLDPERPRIEGLKATQMNLIRQVTDFVEQTQETFSDHVRGIQDGLKGATGKMLDVAKEKISAQTASMIKGLNFGRIRAKLQIPAPNRIKAEAITLLKEKLSNTFSEIVQQHTVRHVAEAVEKSLSSARIEKILEQVSESLERNFAEDYKKIIREFNHNLYEFTLMRAREETWDIIDADIRPAGFEPEWDKNIEKEFREQLNGLFGKRLLAYADNLKRTLWRYYKNILDELIEEFESILADLSESLRGVEDIHLPVDLLGGEGEEFEEKKKAYKLLTYFTIFNATEKSFTEVAPRFSAIGVK
jgi:tRNA U34 5-carboxymethylaminomethyl modifying GTPase MnmE/TrmE